MPEKEKTKKELQEELDALKEENVRLTNENNDLTRANDEYMESRKQFEKDIQAKNEEINRLYNDIDMARGSKVSDEADHIKTLEANFEQVKEFANRRTGELEKAINLLNQIESLFTAQLDLIKQLKDNLLKEIQQ